MRGKVAKAIRKAVYQGKGSSVAFRKYTGERVTNTHTYEESTIVRADASRTLYQQMKKRWKNQGK